MVDLPFAIDTLFYKRTVVKMIKMIISAHLSELHRFVRLYCNRNALFVVNICNKLCVYHTYKGRRQKNCFFYFRSKELGKGVSVFLPFTFFYLVYIWTSDIDRSLF